MPFFQFLYYPVSQQISLAACNSFGLLTQAAVVPWSISIISACWVWWIIGNA
jgi:hypothetical protein